MSDNLPSKNNVKKQYIENIWTNNEGKIDGYTFKGKRFFSKALLGLKSIMIKGQPQEIENIKFTALDTKIQGCGLEIDVEVMNNKNRGVAVLKIYGPKEDNKKDNTVTVSKFKQSDSKFVVILAEKVVIPLMDRFLSGDMEILDAKSGIKTEPKQFKCSFCEKICKSSAGLKSHTSRIHLDIHNTDKKQENNKRKASEEVNDVVESMLTEVISHSDDENTIDEIVENEAKKYTKICNNCDFQVEACKKYITMQKIREHRNMCSFSVTCLQCDKRLKDQTALKRHMRNEHSVMTCSTSPPLKKKKVNFNLDESVEDMEIDKDVNEDEILLQRSKMMDEKVIAKQMKNDEEVQEFLNKKAEKKIQEEESVKEKVRIKSKLKKQKVKNNKKENYVVPNIRNVPENCKDLLNDALVYVVPGDGACGPNSASAHLFEDEVFGPKLRKQMNIFMANHFIEKYQYTTPCSPETPFRRNVKGKVIEFTDSKELIEFLKTSDDALYMWSDSEDLSVIADMYQIRIKVVTTKGPSDKNPTENWIYPDKNLEKYAELKDVEIDDMILLHEDETHFNLVVKKNSTLATHGSLSFRHNIGPMMVMNGEKETQGKGGDMKDNDKQVEDNKECKNINDLKKELQVYKDRNLKLEQNYNQCEKELRNKTEEVEKLKVEIQDLKQIIDLEETSEGEWSKVSKTTNCSTCKFKCKTETSLKKHIDSEHTGKSFSSKECEYPTISESKHKEHIEDKHERSQKCALKTKNKVQQDSHVNRNHTEPEFNCKDCDFQATTQLQLNKHKNLKHIPKGQMQEEVIKCRYCGQQFSEVWNLMSHRKKEHKNTVAFCKNKLLDKCPFDSEKCWWNHEKNSNTNTIECFICNQTFSTKNEMMLHRKTNHAEMVQKCTKDRCTFQEKFCWFIHEKNGWK